MRKTAITVGLLFLSASTTVGCKSAPKLAWWKSNKTDETALAHAAPQLPSDLAKEADAKSAAQVAGGVAAPFKPGATAPAGGYPTTDAPAFTPTAVASNAATGAAAGPYDPSATPTPKATTVASSVGDRYGLGTAVGGESSTAPAYGQAPSYSSTDSLESVASRYGSPAGGVSATTPIAGSATAPAYSPAAVTPVSTASVQPYRPGGTSSYSVTATPDSHVSVASVPGTSSTPPSTAPSAGATTTPEASTPPASTGANRYW